MYRVTAHILHRRTILQCRSPTTVQIKTVARTSANFKYVKPTERETCPTPPPPPPPPPKDDRLLWGAIAALVVAGGFAFYAKQTPEVRDWLSLHAPWFDDLIAIAYRENMSYSEFAEKCTDDAKKCLKNYMDKLLGHQQKVKKCSLDGKLIEEPDQNVPPEPDKCNEKVEKPKCEVIPPPVITKDICEVDKCLRDLGDTIINNYYTARQACACYNNLVEETMWDFNMVRLKELHVALAERLGLVQTSTCNVSEATVEMDELSRYLECGVNAPKDAIVATQGMIADYQDKIAAARMQYQWENDKSIAMDAQVAKVEELVVKYVEENQTLFSGLNYEKKPVLQGDPDLLLYHSMRYAMKLETQLCDASASYTERVNRAMGTLPQNANDIMARNLAMQTEILKRKGELIKEFGKRFELQKANNDKTLKDSLKKQLERHQENLKQKLSQKEKDTAVNLNKKVSESVAAEKKALKTKLAEMAAKLKALDDKLKARLKAERETRLSQELYKAGSSLLAATKKGDRVIRVDKELNAIEKAASGEDKLVQTVLKSIPASIRKDGLVPESVLRERYHKMEKAALAVALVESDGAAMPVFILSWFQSLMLFMTLSCIPQAEIDKPPQEPFKNFDTFDLLRRARYYIERGNLAAAVRYVSSLQGASRAAAQTWYEAARSHLEIRQAAEAVLAHAAALSIQHI